MGEERLPGVFRSYVGVSPPTSRLNKSVIGLNRNESDTRDVNTTFGDVKRQPVTDWRINYVYSSLYSHFYIFYLKIGNNMNVH